VVLLLLACTLTLTGQSVDSDSDGYTQAVDCDERSPLCGAWRGSRW